jgi:uncharacterized lipoprotein YddW (UPF0748 family)
VRKLFILVVAFLIASVTWGLELSGEDVVKLGVALANEIDARGGTIPSNISIPETDYVISIEQSLYFMSKFLAIYGEERLMTGEIPPIVRGVPVQPPIRQIEGELGGRINWDDTFDVSEELANILEEDTVIPKEVSFVHNGEEESTMSPDVLISVLARTIRWINDNGMMPNYASLRPMVPPEEWPIAERVEREVAYEKIGPREGEIVSVWVWGSTLVNYGVERAFSEMNDAGITDVFLLVKGTAGQVNWPSEIAVAFADNTTVLEKSVKEARTYGISIHAWFVINQDAAYLNIHPERRMHGTPMVSGGDYRRAGSTVDFVADTAYRKYLIDMMLEVIELYDVDGIHLDYIRYPTAAWGWGPTNIGRAYMEGLDVDFLLETAIETWGAAGDGTKFIDMYKEFRFSDINRWVAIRMNDIRDFTYEIREAVKGKKPEVVYSASLMPEGGDIDPSDNAFAMVHYGQRYADFGELCDIIIPMAYHLEFGKRATWVEDVFTGTREVTLSKNKVVMGIQGFQLTPLELQQAIYAARHAGADGITLFRFETVFGNEALLEAFLETMEQ